MSGFDPWNELLAGLKQVKRLSEAPLEANPAPGPIRAALESSPSDSRPSAGETSSTSTSAPIPTASPGTGSVLAWQQSVPKRSKRALATGLVAALALGSIGHSRRASPEPFFLGPVPLRSW